MTSDDELRVRSVGGVTTATGDEIDVDHVYTLETCEHGHLEAGMVGLHVKNDDEGQTVNVLMTPDDALVIANRLQRAAELVMEVGEDVADPEREYRRYQAPDGD